MPTHPRIALHLCIGLALALPMWPGPPLRAPRCAAQSGARVPCVVELYTSEGCSSCPPADRWLSTLKGRPDVVALAFHVDYWDRLGWTDRFASAAYRSARRSCCAAAARAMLHAAGDGRRPRPATLVGHGLAGPVRRPACR